MRLRVMVYNVRGFHDGLDRLARVVRRSEPDLLLVNESGGRRRLRRFAREVGMTVAADPWAPLRRRVKDAVLARPPWWIAEHRLHRFADGPLLLPRGALVARLRNDRLEVTAVATHLGLHPGERRRHAKELAHVLREAAGQIVLGGDLNENREGAAASLLASRWRDAWVLGGDAGGETFPALEPSARIDYLFVSEDLRVEWALVPGDAETASASDHRPLVVQLMLPEPE